MALKLRFDPQAKRDIAEIRAYLVANAGEEAADRVRADLRERFNRLRRHPQIGVATNDPTVRILAPTRYAYRIYFTTTSDTLVILHVRHTSRRMPDLDDLQ